MECGIEESAVLNIAINKHSLGPDTYEYAGFLDGWNTARQYYLPQIVELEAMIAILKGE